MYNFLNKKKKSLYISLLHMQCSHKKPNISNESRPISPQKNPAENCVLTINHGLADRIGAEPRSLGFDTRQYFMVLRPQCRTVAVAFAGSWRNGVKFFYG